MKKTLDLLKNVLTAALLVLAVGMMIFTVLSVATFDRLDRKLFGYRAFIVLSDSMSATDFRAGDLVLVKEVDPAALREGDIIAFQSINPDNYGEVVTHKIRRLTTDAEGNPGFVTYGTTTGMDDETVVTYGFVLGRYQTRLPGVGRFFQFLKTTPGYILCILIPFLALILLQGVNSIRLFRRYKYEQTEELRLQREKLEAERRESARMMEELQALKAQLAAQGISRTQTLQLPRPPAPPAQPQPTPAQPASAQPAPATQAVPPNPPAAQTPVPASPAQRPRVFRRKSGS